jgi:hypothetical protein
MQWAFSRHNSDGAMLFVQPPLRAFHTSSWERPSKLPVRPATRLMPPTTLPPAMS